MFTSTIDSFKTNKFWMLYERTINNQAVQNKLNFSFLGFKITFLCLIAAKNAFNCEVYCA